VGVLAVNFGAWAAQGGGSLPPRIQDQPGFDALDAETARWLVADMGGQ
jgi:hypothetical protein